MYDITALGEALIDLTELKTETQGPAHFAACPGGAPANLACAAAKMGARSAFIGKVGTDAFGDMLQRTIQNCGADTHCMYRSADIPTTLAVVSIARNGERSFQFYRTPGADLQLTQQEALAALRGGTRILHVGSLSMTAEPCRSAELAAVGYARQQGALISYDPNYRAPLWPSQDEAVREMRSLLPLCDILKLSDEELPLLTGTGDPAAGSLMLQREGPQLVLVTLGAGGVFFRFRDTEGVEPGFAVPVADTNGAGDTFLGTVLALLAARGLLKDLEEPELRQMLRRANAAAALTCTRTGAIPAMPDAAETEQFLRQHPGPAAE